MSPGSVVVVRWNSWAAPQMVKWGFVVANSVWLYPHQPGRLSATTIGYPCGLEWFSRSTFTSDSSVAHMQSLHQVPVAGTTFTACNRIRVLRSQDYSLIQSDWSWPTQCTAVGTCWAAGMDSNEHRVEEQLTQHNLTVRQQAILITIPWPYGRHVALLATHL